MEQVQSENRGAMIDWFTSQATTPRSTEPCEALVRFIAKTYGVLGLAQRYSVQILDIGSGSGANSHYLERQGYHVTALDSARRARAHVHCSLDIFFDTIEVDERYDCIIDINALCHIERPRYEDIHKALRPRGKFFSIHPADGTEVDMTGKGYTRIADIMTMRQLLTPFPLYTIHKCTNWSGDTKINSWQIEADK